VFDGSFFEAMHTAIVILTSFFLLLPWPSEFPQAQGQATIGPPPPPTQRDHVLFDRVIENQKKNDAAMDVYERIERVETHRTTGENQTTEVKTSRVVPAGTGAAHIPVGPDGKAADAAAYRVELEKLEKSLVWAADTGRAQHDAYERIAKKRREREELIGAARNAFIFTLLSNEQRNGRTLLKYSMTPNPAFKPTSRSTSVYAHVRGTVWIDEDSGELARIEGEVMDDISLGLFLAKVYRGSHFMQERYEMAPGLWLPTFSQYDFDGRKFLASFSLHERTFYSTYRLVGTPKEALAMVRAELKDLHSASRASP
jgi:hypothetical protein